MSQFQPIFEFEKRIADYFSSPYAVAVDCCTHGIEMCLRLNNSTNIICPQKTYISIPLMLEKIGIKYEFKNIKWNGFYHLTPEIIDAATFWKKDSYIKNTKMCLSFHIKKHINIGRGGMILLDNENDYLRLKKMRYDGRSIYDDVLYKDDDITEIGYHYYMTPEIANIGIKIFENKKNQKPNKVSYKNYSDVTKFTFFKNKI